MQDKLFMFSLETHNEWSQRNENPGPKDEYEYERESKARDPHDYSKE